MALSSRSSRTLLIAIISITLFDNKILITIEEFLIKNISINNILALEGLDRGVYLIAS